MASWVNQYVEQSDLNKYPVSFRSRGGVGFKLPDGDTLSVFNSRPIHYRDGNEWMPITLEFNNGSFKGSPFGWNGVSVTYLGKHLYTPVSITFNEKVFPLCPLRRGNSLIQDIPGIGIFTITISENAVRETLLIPEPLEGVLSFQTLYGHGNHLPIKSERVILGDYGQSGEVFILTPEMKYPLIIDPDYGELTNSGMVYGISLVDYATARSMATNNRVDLWYSKMGQSFFSGTSYQVYTSYFKFLTSGIPNDDEILQVNFVGVTNANPTTTYHYDVIIQEQDWSADDPITSSNRETVYDECIGGTNPQYVLTNTYGIVLDQVVIGEDMSTDYPSKGGYSYYSGVGQRTLDNTTAQGWDQEAPFDIYSEQYGSKIPLLRIRHRGEERGQFFWLFNG